MERISEFLNLNEEQSQILAPERKIAVRAGAGSGKTRAIIAKYLKILESGEADIPQIVAVTFTENAAAELKSRIGEKIEEYISTYGTKGYITKDWRRKFFSAPIGTIHSFCNSILRDNSIESKIPFNFSVIESAEEELFWKETVSRFLLAEVENDSSKLKRLLEMESYDSAQIVKVIAMILQEAAKLHLLPPFSYAGDTDLQNPSARELRSMNRNLREALSEHISTLPNTSGNKKRVLEDIRERIDLTLGIDRNIRHLRDIYQQIDEERKTPEVERSRIELRDILFLIINYYDCEINPLYLDLAGEAYQFLAKVKISEEKIQYEDMIRFTIDMLKENPEILDYYKGFLKFIIVDEFQDTDSLQLELMKLLTDSDSAGSLIAVGDINQSIYGFRGAQPEIFAQILKDEKFKKISFATNYRSCGSLINFFNEFFSDTFPEGHYENMKQPDCGLDSDISVEMIVCAGENRRASIEKEAQGVVSKIKELQENESCGEIALLFRRGSEASIYERALISGGIKFRSFIGHDFYHLSEIRDVVSMLKYFLDPKDTLALASILRSPYFGASDDELFSYFRGEEKKDTGKIAEYVRFLNEKREEYVNSDTYRAVDFVVNGLGYFSAMRMLPDGEIKCLNLKKFLLIAENLASSKGCGLSQVVENFDFFKNSREKQAFEETSDRKTVKLMTVHGAKGLEFENVFLCHANYRRNPKNDRVIAGIDEGFVVRYSALSSSNWGELKSSIEEKEAEEEKRILYVAMTRAEKRLFIFLNCPQVGKKKKISVQKESFAKLILLRLYRMSLISGNSKWITSVFSDEEDSKQDEDLQPLDAFSEETEEETFKELVPSKLYKILGGSRNPQSATSVFSDIEDAKRAEDPQPPDAFSEETEISSELKYAKPLYKPAESPINEAFSLPDLFYPTNRLTDPERTGSIMHRFLETWNFMEETKEKEIQFVLGEFLALNSDMQKLLRELSSNFRASELFTYINGAQEIRKELKFVFDSGQNDPKRGRIDLLIEEETGFRLFDYKYRESLEDDIRDVYREQMDGYCEAISSRFEKPLISRHIVLIPKVELVSI